MIWQKENFCNIILLDTANQLEQNAVQTMKHIICSKTVTLALNWVILVTLVACLENVLNKGNLIQNRRLDVQFCMYLGAPLSIVRFAIKYMHSIAPIVWL